MKKALYDAQVIDYGYGELEFILWQQGATMSNMVQFCVDTLAFMNHGLHALWAAELASYRLHSSETIYADSDVYSRASLALLQNLEANYFLFQITAIILALLCGILALVSQLFSRDMVQDAEKKSTYECGFSPYDSATRLPFDVHFYVVGIMFLVFDVELALLTTAAVLAAALPWTALVNIAAFVIILTIGFIYEWARGALRWEAKAAEPI